MAKMTGLGKGLDALFGGAPIEPSVEAKEELLENNENLTKKGVTVVSQTTFNKKNWILCQEILKKVCTNAKIFDTICNATSLRQTEAAELALTHDLMVVIGGRHSSNTSKLFDVCQRSCFRTYLIEI